jgi:hypothetical protein
MSQVPAQPSRKSISPMGWIAICFSSLTLCAAGLLAYLVATAEKGPPPKVEELADPLLISQEADDTFVLPVDKAILEGSDLAIERRAIGEVIGGWKSENDRIAWRLKLKKAGIYEIFLTYSNAKSEGEPVGKFEFRCGEEKIVASARPSGGVETSVTDKVFLKLGPTGEVKLELSAVSVPGGEFLAIKEVRIEPKLRQRRKA